MLLVSCAGMPSEEREPAEIVQLLESGQPVFGMFSGEKTAAQGAAIARNRETDFVFYSMERGPFDIEQMQVFMRAMADGAGDAGAHPFVLRIPPIRDGEDVALEGRSR